DDAAGARALDVHAHQDAVPDVLLGHRFHELVLLVQAAQLLVAAEGVAAPQAKLVQARALADQDAEGAGRYLGVELPLVAFPHAIEFGAVVRDEAREDVEAPGGALRVADARR